jgi:hypothetical protein
MLLPKESSAAGRSTRIVQLLVKRISQAGTRSEVPPCSITVLPANTDAPSLCQQMLWYDDVLAC